MTNKDNIPEKLLEKREVTEASFIFSLYKEPTLADDYAQLKSEEDIITQDGIFYFNLLKAMRKAGYTQIDNISIYGFLADKKSVREAFEERGGWSEIKNLIDLVNVDNVDAYYDDLIKSNLLIRLNEEGFPVLQNLDKFSAMSCENVYDYFDYKLSNIAIGKVEKAKDVNLSDGYDDWIEKWDKGEDVGFEIGLHTLNYRLLGLHKRNLMLHLASIGKGKTTTAIAWYVIPSLINGNDVTIIANEQGESEWRQMLLSTVMFNHLPTKVQGLNRHKLMVGNFTDDQKKLMKQAAKWLKDQPGKVRFIEVEDYSDIAIKRLISKYSRLGCSLMIVDTLKPMDETNERAWAEFSEVAKSLFQCAKKYDVAVVATCQLSPEAMSRAYLDLTCVGKSKALSETATAVTMFRPLTEREKESIEPWNFDKNNPKIKVTTSLDTNKDYIMIFTPKNRFGSTDPQIVVERNMDFNTYKEIGYYQCSYDFGKR